MPKVSVTLSPEKREVAPGESTLSASLRNESGGPISVNLDQLSNPSLVLEIRDPDGRQAPLPPPSVPHEKPELARLAPGESLEVSYAGFLDRSAPAGVYRVRFSSIDPELGGSIEEPVRSEWQQLSVAAATQIAVKTEPTRLPEVAAVTFLSGFLDAIHRIICFLRRLLGLERCDRVLEREVDEARSETITNAPPPNQAWNNTYGWRARFHERIDQRECQITVTVRIRLAGNITNAQRNAWETAIENKWNNKFKLCCRCCCCRDGYQIGFDVQFVNQNEHHVVNVQNSTTNMTNWGRNDTVDVTHEFGHMLGALDEYFTVDGVDWGPGRQANGSIMNNPANNPAARHFNLIRDAARALLGTRCVTRGVNQNCP